MEKGHTGSQPAVSADCAVTIIVSDSTKYYSSPCLKAKAGLK